MAGKGKDRRSRRLLRPSMIVVYILGAYLIVNYVLRVGGHVYPETMKLVNFGVFVYLIYHFLRKPLLDMIDAKIADVDELLKTTESQLAEARSEHEEAQRLLSGLEADIAKIGARSRELGQVEREALIEDGRERAASIISQASVALKGREREIRREIVREVAQRCVDVAGAKISQRLTPDLHLALVRSRISAIGRRS